MSEYKVAEDYDKNQMSSDPVTSGDEAAGSGAATDQASPRDTSPTAEGRQPADVGPADNVGVDERPGEPVVVGETAGETGAYQAGQVGAPGSADSSAGSAADRVLLDRESFQRRWQDVQALFVDGPRHAVEEADSLIGDAVREFSDALAARRSGIEHDWNDAGDVSTEKFRLALLRYRDVFQLLLSV